MFEITLDNTNFKCFLDPKSRKNLNVTIKPNNEIKLSKPARLSKEHLIEYLEQNSEWILAKSQQVNDVAEKRSNNIHQDYVRVFGEKVYYEDYPTIKEDLYDILNNYVSETRQMFDELFQKEPTIDILPLKGKWGACSPAIESILLNETLVHYPVDCINYVMIHEYVHLLIPNHSKDFYDLVERIMPGYRECIDYLKVH